MERTKKTIGKLLAVIALAVAMLICGVLLGCGLKREDELGNQVGGDKQNSTEPVKPDDGEEEYDPDKVVLIPPSVPSSGAHLSIGVENSNDNDIDDVVVDVLYGFDIKQFNGYWGSTKVDDEEYTTKKICVIAFDMSIYSNTLHSVNDDSALYNNLIELDVGEANNGALLIDEIPFTAEMRAPEKYPEDIHQCLYVDTLLGTDYACETEYKYLYEEVVYNKKNSVRLPRELFADDSGLIVFSIVLCMESDKNNVYAREISSYESSAYVKYAKHDGQVDFIDARFGEKYSIKNNGTTPKSKSRINTKNAIEIKEDKKETAEIESTAQCKGVEGVINWIDSSSGKNKHPAQDIMISVYYQSGSTYTSLGNCYTDMNGYYSFTFSVNNIISDDVFICIRTSSKNIFVHGTSSSVPYMYNTRGKIIPDYWNDCAQISVDIGMDDIFGQALQVSQAVITAARYATEMNGSALPIMEVVYPIEEAQGCYFYSNRIYVPNIDEKRQDLQPYESWDVIMHEYAHYVQKYKYITQNPGGPHGFYTNHSDICYASGNYSPQNCKPIGVNLAWAEGWATAYAFMAQNYYSDNLVGINTVCNAIYEAHNFDKEKYYDAENMSLINREPEDVFVGEANEVAVISFLWDLFDDNENEDFDRISLSHEQMWNYVVTSKAKTLSEFVNYISDKLPRDDLADLLDKYEMNANELKLDYNWKTLQFSWNPRGGSKYYPNNLFELKVYDAKNNLLFSHGNIRSSSYIVTNEELNKLLQNYGDFYWTVDAYQLDDDKGGSCLTGPYITSFTAPGQTFDYLYGLNEKRGTIDGNNSVRFYKFTSDVYLNGTISVVGNDGMKVNCTLFEAPISSTSKRVSNSGAIVGLPYEFTTGGITVFICVSGYGGATGSFRIKVDQHVHSYSGWTSISSTSHSKSCSCGDVVTGSHTWTVVGYDSTTHTRRCTVCGYTVTQLHCLVGSPGGDEMVCYSCGYRYKR